MGFDMTRFFSPPRRARGMVGRRAAVVATAGLVTGLVTLVAACSNLTDAPPPSDIADPGTVKTLQSATSMYAGVVSTMSQAFAGLPSNGHTSFVVVSGLFSDEYTGGAAGQGAYYDSHTMTSALSAGTASPYRNLQTVRIGADNAIRALAQYDDATVPSKIAELHALKGYVYVLLSELYCSGIPFSTVTAGGVTVFGSAETTVQALTDAVAQFDSAAALAGDSVRIADLAAVGKGRALLDLGKYSDAKTAVASVPTTFAYQLTYSATSREYSNFMVGVLGVPLDYLLGFYVADQEGSHGLPYITQSDVRIPTIMTAGHPLPAKFAPESTPVSLADGIEARLIEAEADLQGHDVPGWASVLNTLREGASIPDLTADSTTGAANDSARVDVLFRERAYWLFGMGHRAGDMRRLVRQYRRSPAAVYPMGAVTYPTPALPYIPVPTLPVPDDEAQYNPNYTGCIDHDA